ncbi:MAG: polysaccharide deacetylase family protein [Azonexus sp.]
MMIKPLLWAVSPGGTKGNLTIFIFHRVLSQPDELFPDEPDVSRFNEILGWIKHWFNILPLDKATRLLQENKLPPRAAAITFDDGYADNYTNALPILKKHGLCATFFIATGFLDGGKMWNDIIIESIRNYRSAELDLSHVKLGTFHTATLEDKKRTIMEILMSLKYRPIDERTTTAYEVANAIGAELPTNLMMTHSQLLAMHKEGMQIGAHTVSHPILSKTPLQEARREISESKTQLEQLLGEKISLFAYPNGKAGVDFHPEHARLVQELGFDAAVTTDWGTAHRCTNAYTLPRFTPWDKSRTRFGLRLLRNFSSTL